VLQEELGQIEDQRCNLRKQLEEIEARDMEIKRHAAAEIQTYALNNLEAEILVALLSGRSSAEFLAERLEVPTVLVEESLKGMLSRGAVKLAGGVWSI
jgi:predicted transcriptional regulator